MAVSANRLELLQIADAVAREKSIDRGIVIAAMEDAIAKAARSRYGAETDVHAEIEPKTGDLRLTRHMLVTEAVENPSNQITLEEARKRNLLTVALLGYDGGEIVRRGLADYPLVVRSDYIPRIQEVQASISACTSVSEP